MFFSLLFNFNSIVIAFIINLAMSEVTANDYQRKFIYIYLSDMFLSFFFFLYYRCPQDVVC